MVFGNCCISRQNIEPELGQGRGIIKIFLANVGNDQEKFRSL